MKRIRYISAFAKPMSDADIDALVEKAQAHNASVDVTGVLVATGKLFYQLIEGPDDAIDALYERICADERHQQVLLLSSEQGEFDRLCPDWAMQKVELGREAAERTAPVRTLLHLAFVQRQLADEALAALESYTWQGIIEAELGEG